MTGDRSTERSGIKDELLKQFDLYDTTVDVVSCWESFVEHSYRDEMDSLKFDRFPCIPDPRIDGKKLTPDFTVCFDKKYGIIGEISRTFPKEEEYFLKEMEQLLNYDGELSIKSDDGKECVPDTTDILLLIEGTAAPQIVNRIRGFVDEGKLGFNNNLIIMRYTFNQSSTFSRYEFQKEFHIGGTFRDSVLPGHCSLSKKFDEEYETLKVYPRHFAEIKSRKPICNDEPPPHYLATIFWHKFFADHICEEDYKDWRWGTASKIKSIVLEPYEFTRRVNERFNLDGDVRVKWVKDSLDFLCAAKLATYDHREKTYEVGFRDFKVSIGEKERYQNGLMARREVKELTYKFIDRYARYSKEDIKADGDEEKTHPTLLDF